MPFLFAKLDFKMNITFLSGSSELQAGVHIHHFPGMFPVVISLSIKQTKSSLLRKSELSAQESGWLSLFALMCNRFLLVLFFL